MNVLTRSLAISIIFFFSSRRRHTRWPRDWSSDVCSSDLSIFDVVVPVEQVIENKDGKKKLVKRKLLPGYVLVRMELNDAAWRSEERRVGKVCRLRRETYTCRRKAWNMMTCHALCRVGEVP